MNKKKIAELISEQEQHFEMLKSLIEETDISALIEDNEVKQKQLDTMVEKEICLYQEIEALTNQCKEHKQMIQNMLFQEKFHFAEKNEIKLANALPGVASENTKKIRRMEQRIISEAKNLQTEIAMNIDAYDQELSAKLQHIKEDMVIARQLFEHQVEAQQQEIYAEIQKEHEAMVNEPIDDMLLVEQQKLAKKETTFGLKLFNYLGIAFIFFAAIGLGLLSIEYITQPIKSILLYVVSTAFLIAGEMFWRKDKKIFSLGLIGGSIGLYYIVAYLSYFVLGVFSVPMMLAALSLTTILAITISVVHKSEALTCISLLGAYLPVFSLLHLIGVSATSIIVAQIYIFLLHALMLFLYRYFSWKYVYRISFFCVLPWLFVFSYLGTFPWYVDYSYNILYVVIYAIIPLFFTKKDKAQEISIFDELLIMGAFGILLGVTIGYATWAHSNRNVLLYAISFAIVLLVRQWLKRFKTEFSILPAVFSVGCLLIASSFLMYYIPFVWLNDSRVTLVGIMVMLVFYTYYNRMFAKNSITIMTVSHYILFYALYVGHLLSSVQAGTSWTLFDQLLVFFGMIPYYLYTTKITTREGLAKEYSQIQEMSFIVLYVQANYLIIDLFDRLLASYSYTIHLFDRVLILIPLLLCLNACMFFYKKAAKYYLPHILALFLVAVLFYINTQNMSAIATSNVFVRGILFVVTNLGAYMYIFYTIYRLRKEIGVSSEMLGVLEVAFVLINGTLFAYTNIKFGYLNIILDIIYGVVAVIFIIAGFKKSYAYMRRIGLYSILIVMAKLMLLDISTVTLLSKTIAFFVFGLLSLGLSYIYQRALNSLVTGKKQEKKIAESLTEEGQ